MKHTANSQNGAEGAGPLAGIKVLDLSAYIAGPYGCALLGDLGAEVIKVEPPEGDNLRKYPSTLPNESRAFLGVNRGKRGIGVDLKQPRGYEVLIKLVQSADVLVHNFRPAVPKRLRIDYDTLRQVNPGLVYCAMTGYGSTGPMADNAGYDQVLQSMTGICALQGKAEGPPEIVYGSVVDYYGAAMIAQGVTAALFQRERTGLGQSVEVSLLGSALAMQSARLVWAEGEPRDVPRDMRSGGITGIHPTGEGYLYISANTPHFWKALCERLGQPALAEQAKYATVKERARHAGELVPIIRAALARKTAAEWETAFGKEVPCAVVKNVEDMFDHPQVLAQGMVADLHTPTIGKYKGVGNFIKFGQGAPRPFSAAPAFGEHTRQVLADMGYTPGEVQALIDESAVR